MTLLSVSPSKIGIGSIIDAVGPLNSSWKRCDGSILNQSDYTQYVNKAFDLHPFSWTYSELIGSTSFTLAKGQSISKMGNTIIAMPYASQKVYYSTDNGDTWSESGNVLPSSGNWAYVTNNGSIFVALRQGSTAGAYSSNGTSWTSFTMPASKSWSFLGWNGTIFAACASEMNATIYYSSNGYDWSSGASFGSGVTPGGFPKGADDDGYFIFQDYENFKMHKTNNGSSLTTAANPTYWDDYDSCQDYFHYLNDRWWTYSTQGITWLAYSTDNGDTWQRIPHLNQIAGWEYFYMYCGNSFYSGEEYVFLDYNGGPNWLIKDNSQFFINSRLNTLNAPIDSVFISKEKGVIVLCSTQMTSVTAKLKRLKYTSYDYTTQFQLPNLRPHIPGMDKYIKVK